MNTLKNQFVKFSRYLFMLHKPTMKTLINTPTHSEYLCDYDSNRKFLLTYINSIKPPTLETNLYLTNIVCSEEVKYLNSYLEYFKGEINVVSFVNPNLHTIALFMTCKNLFETNNYYFVRDLNKDFKHLVPNFEKINNTINHSTWNFE